MPIYTAIRDFLAGIWNDIKNTAESVWNAIVAFFTPALNNFKNNFTTVWNAISGVFTTTWNAISGTATNTWNSISGFLNNGFNSFRTGFNNVWNGIVGDFNNIWGKVTGIAQTVWNNVVGAFTWGVNQVIGLINKLVDGADVVLKFLLIPLIPHIPGLAAGGVVGLAGGGTVGAGFQTNGPMAIVGEGRPQHPEYVIPTDPAHRGNALSLYQSLGAKLMAGGGIIDWIGSTVSKVEQWAGSGATGVMNKAVDGLAGGLNEPYRDIAGGIGHKIVAAIKAMIDKAQAATAAAGASFSAPFTGSPNLAAWIQQAIGLTGVPASWAGPMSVLIGRESGGNPNAINNWDSNAKAGHPSQGLTQTIPSTFNAYHQAGTSWNILDPVANIAASINYIKSRYGSIFNVAQANPNHAPQGYDAGGLLPTGLSLVRNSTGQPERVLNATQTAKLDRLLAGRGGQSVTVNVMQTSGSPAETGRFVALALRTVS
jgi:SLT domain-containing protein